MTLIDFGVVVVGGLIGWAIVSWIVSIVRQQKQPPVDLTRTNRSPLDLVHDAPTLATREPRALSLADVSQTWSAILGVPDSATAQDIETAYHARLAECDEIRFSSSAPAEAKASAQARRSKITQAFEFIRPLKS